MIVSFFTEALEAIYMSRKLCLFHNTWCNHPLKQAVWLIRKKLKSVFISKNHCGPALLKIPIYSTELVAMFEKYHVKCPKALTEIPFFHDECVNLTISQQRLQIFIKCIVNVLEGQL